MTGTRRFCGSKRAVGMVGRRVGTALKSRCACIAEFITSVGSCVVVDAVSDAGLDRHVTAHAQAG